MTKASYPPPVGDPDSRARRGNAASTADEIRRQLGWDLIPSNQIALTWAARALPDKHFSSATKTVTVGAVALARGSWQAPACNLSGTGG